VIAPETLDRLEAQVLDCLDRGSYGELDIIDYGEISTVLAAEGTDGPVVCKRLPVMTRHELEAYERVLRDYLTVLTQRGVTVAPSAVRAVGDDPVTPYCIQPRYRYLLIDDLRTGGPDLIESRLTRLCNLVMSAARDGVGIDAQISNWAVEEDDLIYLDVTTPLLLDAAGKQRTNLDLFIASLPWLLRGAVRRFLLDEILSHYHSARPALVDAVANLNKERAGDVIPLFLNIVNSLVIPPLTADEARKYYRQDALMWAVLQRLRRGDRWWQQRVRHRRYPFLLPGTIRR
jgi:hypothetical protein